MSDTQPSKLRPIGVVVIGRNEGERLKRCLRSLVGDVECMVYVDSRSTDGSAEFAKSIGVKVIDLDMSQAFTMARGRNAGWRYLAQQDDPVEFVQFVDGDCEVADGWVEKAYDTLCSHPDVVAVCGRRRERSPEASIYNTLMDMEWEQPPGEARYCGGDAMIRLEAIKAVDGYNQVMIAGEEPEMSVRLRQRGGRILRIAAEMTLHDAAMTRFSQWWKRAIRGGHAYAEGASMHGAPPERHCVRQVRSVLTYGGLIPGVIVLFSILAVLVNPMLWIGSALAALAYPFVWWRIYRHRRRMGNSAKLSCLYSTFCVMGKFAELQGVLTFWFNRIRGKRTGLLEYKQAEPMASPKA